MLELASPSLYEACVRWTLTSTPSFYLRTHAHTCTGETKPFVRNVFTLNTCSNIVGSQVLSFKDESKMLAAWQEFLEEVDPDLVIGYNTANFDIPYLMDRARKIKATSFPYLGRLKSESSIGGGANSSRTSAVRLRKAEIMESLMAMHHDCRALHVGSHPRTHVRTHRGQVGSQRHPLQLKSLRSERLKGNKDGRPTTARYPPGHAERLQAQELQSQLRLCPFPRCVS